ncbi:MAG TPA: alpha/beta hydrolase [Planctomycetaceae bacterium]|jgi:alpha-beta hydrolase superfamily lysophospholipase|nr:alpha/beta hydrolase [Planctomycetaceae bacterium]
MRFEEAFLKADDGVALFVRRFEPLSRDADRSVILVHGMSEHGQCYQHVAESMVARGWNVVVPDLRGHGRSGGDPIHVNDFSEYVTDLKRIIDSIGLRSQTTVLVGHSMGGLISARFVQQFPHCVSALALLSPLLGVRVRISPFTVALARLLSLVRPRSRFRKRTKREDSTRNQEALTRGDADPLIRESVTAAWYFAMRQALRSVWDLAEQISCPVLVMQAGADLIVDPAAPQGWLQRVGSEDKSLRMFPDHYHELLNEIDWSNTLADMLDWLEQRLIVPRGDLLPLPAARIQPASLGATSPLLP